MQRAYFTILLELYAIKTIKCNVILSKSFQCHGLKNHRAVRPCVWPAHRIFRSCRRTLRQFVIYLNNPNWYRPASDHCYHDVSTLLGHAIQTPAPPVEDACRLYHQSRRAPLRGPENHLPWQLEMSESVANNRLIYSPATAGCK